MEEMLNNRRHKKLTKKLPKGQTTSPKDGTNFEKVLIEKMEQHNWTLLIACKICQKKKKKCPELDADYIKFISYGRANDEPHYSANYTHWFTISLHKRHSSDLIFKNNHGSRNFAKLTRKHLRRGLVIEKGTPTQVRFCFSVNLAKFLRITCLQNTSGRLPLYFIEKRKTCFWP